jgi:hypothetical protein
LLTQSLTASVLSNNNRFRKWQKNIKKTVGIAKMLRQYAKSIMYALKVSITNDVFWFVFSQKP